MRKSKLLAAEQYLLRYYVIFVVVENVLEIIYQNSFDNFSDFKMPKNDVGGPKWLANKMKSKGLQKLRWYCQMCEKQCRDENGFKCHVR